MLPAVPHALRTARATVRRRLRLHRRSIAALLTAVAVLAGLGAVTPAPAGRPVVVADRAVPAGHRLTPADVTVALLPDAAVPEGSYDETSAVLGAVTALPLAPREAVTRLRLVGAELLGELGDDLLAVPLHVADAAVAALVAPGTVVDVYAPPDLHANDPRRVADAARVLSVGPEPTLLVVAVPRDRAGPLTAAAARGPLGLALHGA